MLNEGIINLNQQGSTFTHNVHIYRLTLNNIVDYA